MAPKNVEQKPAFTVSPEKKRKLRIERIKDIITMALAGVVGITSVSEVSAKEQKGGDTSVEGRSTLVLDGEQTAAATSPWEKVVIEQEGPSEGDIVVGVVGPGVNVRNEDGTVAFKTTEEIRVNVLGIVNRVNERGERVGEQIPELTATAAGEWEMVLYEGRIYYVFGDFVTEEAPQEADSAVSPVAGETEPAPGSVAAEGEQTPAPENVPEPFEDPLNLGRYGAFPLSSVTSSGELAPFTRGVLEDATTEGKRLDTVIYGALEEVENYIYTANNGKQVLVLVFNIDIGSEIVRAVKARYVDDGPMTFTDDGSSIETKNANQLSPGDVLGLAFLSTEQNLDTVNQTLAAQGIEPAHVTLSVITRFNGS